nr:hypothetical protein [Allomuricauda sp.]
MGKGIIILLILLLASCSGPRVSEADLSHLNGYWEIQEVIFPDGASKSYGMNPNIDFIQLDGTTGYRKKLQPKFTGQYQTSNQTESFEIVKGSETFVMSYENSLDTWEETLIQLDSTSFTVKNGEGVRYVYKRFEPITIPK